MLTFYSKICNIESRFIFGPEKCWFASLRADFSQVGAADAEIKVHSVENIELKGSPIKVPSVDNIELKGSPIRACSRYDIYATLTTRDFFLANFYPSGPFTCIFSKPLPSFSFVGCG